MQITNETTTYEIAELMGPEADETDGRIMLGHLIFLGITDTDDLSEQTFSGLIDETQKIRASEEEAQELLRD